MATNQFQKHITAVHVHSFYYHTTYGPKQLLKRFLNQFNHFVALAVYFLGFLYCAMTAPHVLAILHLPAVAALLFIIVVLGNKINLSAAGRRNFRKFEKLKKSTVIYI